MDLFREKGTYRKRWRGRLPVALIFPNTYRVGMANLGFLAWYEFLNQFDEIVCERIFWDRDLSRIRSLESDRPLRDFKVILVSLPFEGDYPRLLAILKAAGLSIWAGKRDQPVIAGGIATWLNPTPLFPFVDGFLLGELEVLGLPLVEALLSPWSTPEELEDRLKDIPGFLKPGLDLRVRIAKAPVLERPLLSHVTTPEAEFGECQLLEVTRGCGEGCRFCAAGYLYRPPRRPEKLHQALDELRPGSRVGLIGLEFLKHAEVEDIAWRLRKAGHTLSFSSLRVDALRPELAPLFEETRTVTLAIEAGSERLRRIINKRLPEETIFEVASLLRSWPVKRLKLYFMVGLPGENKEDLAKIPPLVSRIRKLSGKRIRVSLAPFVPKPWTPFQWARFGPPEELAEKLKYLRKELASIGIQVVIEPLQEALLQALLSRGDSQMKEFLQALAQGVRLRRALSLLPRPFTSYLTERPTDVSLPWEEKVDPGLDRAFLLKEWERAQQEKESPPCPRQSKCHLCGACLILGNSSFGSLNL